MTLARPARFRPHRLGIVGLYEYADQTFHVEDGRLGLRGRNTSGKSKALELLIPYVLDGDITPRKLDPFASSAKTMRWNLIECTDPYPDRRATKRVGYVWAEFRAVDDAGAGRFFTCGLGLEATRSADGIKDRWYFTTTRRVGVDLTLARRVGGADDQQAGAAAATPVVKSDLVEQLGALGSLHDGPIAYKEALRSQLLPFATSELYEQMLEVIRQLRKPKLSDSLNVKGLSTMLSAALPTVDEQLVHRLGDALEQLHELQRQHDELSAARSEVAALVSGEARAYARGLLELRGARLRTADAAYERARSTLREADAAHEQAAAALQAARERAAGLAARHRHVDEEYLELVGSDAYQVVAALEARVREHEGAERRADRAREALARREEQLARADDAHATESAERDAASAQLAAAGTALHALLAIVAVAPVPLDRGALDALPARLALRAQDVEQALDLAREASEAQAQLRAIADPLALASQRRDEAGVAAAAAQELVGAASEELGEALHEWRLALVELALDDDELAALAAALIADRDARGRLREYAGPRALALSDERALAAARRDRLRGELREARARLEQIELVRDAPPSPRSPRRASRAGRPGAPLWAACDFRAELPLKERAALEAALEEAGLLDAWIGPDGTIHDADLTLLAASSDPGPAHGTLADLLVADPAEQRIAAATTRAVLASIALQGPISVRPGSFRFGSLYGRVDKEEPEYIGASARAALRARLLEQVRAEVGNLESRLHAVAAELDRITAAQARLEDEQRGLPAVDALRSAQRAVRRTADRLAAAEEQLAALVAQREHYDKTAAGARARLIEHARERDLPGDVAQLRAAASAIERANGGVESVCLALDGVDAASRRVASSARSLDEARAAALDARDDRDRAADELAAAAGRMAAAQTVDGASADELRARASALRTEREQLDGARTRAEQDHRERIAAQKDGERLAGEAQAAVSAAETERVGALDAVRVLGRHGIFAAALGADGPADERTAESWTLTAALERVRALAPLDQGVDLGARARRLSEAASRIARKLVAFDMDAATYTSDDITLVEIVREGRRRTPNEMLSELDDDLLHREQVLSAKRREVLGRALLGEIAEHLRTRITEVRASIRARNDTLRRCPTGAGRTVSLSWDADDDAGVPTAVLELLAGRAAEHLTDAQRDSMFAFLEQRIADARAGADDAAAQTALVDHLAVALDYRRWWRFALHLHERDGSTRRLTQRTQGLGSGGEQSVLMHLPLFATAAALYDLAPGAPRIVALDEAMDGIDAQTREQVFALLVELDLDWVMTSYDLNPCVATVPRAGFYELHRDNAEWGVWAQHFVWDGRKRIELIDG